MNPQKRRTIGKYRVAEDHYCQGVKQKNILHSQGRKGGEKRRKGRGGTRLFKKEKELQVLVTQWASSPPTG